MWLLDANMDVHLASVLTGLGIHCDTAADRVVPVAGRLIDWP
jgi:hypothetical protein